jgi:hypothetical protein
MCTADCKRSQTRLICKYTKNSSNTKRQHFVSIYHYSYKQSTKFLHLIQWDNVIKKAFLYFTVSRSIALVFVIVDGIEVAKEDKHSRKVFHFKHFNRLLGFKKEKIKMCRIEVTLLTEMMTSTYIVVSYFRRVYMRYFCFLDRVQKKMRKNLGYFAYMVNTHRFGNRHDHMSRCVTAI